MIASKCRNWRALAFVHENDLRYHASCWRLTQPDAAKPSSPSSMQCGSTTSRDVLKVSSENCQSGFSEVTRRGEPETSQ